MSTEPIAGKYRIVREIARSNDVVYEAIDVAMGRRLAIKELLIPPNLQGAARRERIERFNREARAAGKLSHPCIVTVYDFGEDAGRYFIAMEYLEGGTLRDALQMRGALPLREAVDIACQVLSALAHAHSHNVVHRDVKPDNIHLQPDGYPKLTDFGIARLTEEASLTSDGQVFGTPSYMAPEQIEGKPVDQRSDVFALGVVLYEMLAGRKPFTGDSVIGIAHAIMNATPSPLTGAPGAVEQVVMRAISKSPDQRWPTADAMRTALRAAETAPQTPTPPMYQTQSFPQQPYGAAPQPAPWSPPPSPAWGQPQQQAPTGYTYTGNAPPQGQPPTVPGFTAMAPPMTPPPPLPTRARRPVPVGVRTFWNGFLITVIVAGAVVGMVLLFLKAWEQQQSAGAQMAANQALTAGNRAFEAGDLEAAENAYRVALRASGAGPTSSAARVGLAASLNRSGLRAYQLRDAATAVQCFREAETEISAVPAGDATADKLREDIRYNLQRAGQALGDPGAEALGGTDGASGTVDPTAPGDLSVFEARAATAQQELAAGDQCLQNGALTEARDHWQRAVAAAPGTQPALEAQARLNSHQPEPSFGR
jgi:serine/threonine-protein kinase